MASNFSSFVPKKSNYNDYTDENYFESLFSALVALLSTPKGFHPYDPNYGVGIRSFLMQTDNGNLSQLIEADIKMSIQKYIPNLFPLCAVTVTREINNNGIGYKYNIHIVVENVIVTFDVTKQGTLVFKGSTQ